MAQNKSTQTSQLRVAGLFLRRKAGQEFHTYISLLNYNPEHYEVLLRKWPSEPFRHHLSAFSGPVITGEDPQATLLRESQNWSINLAAEAEVDSGRGLEGRRAVFLSVHGGQVDPLTKKELQVQGIIMSYVVPVKHSDSSIVSKYPNSSDYPKFQNFGELLGKMFNGGVKIHPHTRQMLSSLDHWLREQHALPGAINNLFAPSLQSRVKMCIRNPLLSQGFADETPNQSFQTQPLLSSTPFHGKRSTLDETTASTLAKLNETSTSLREYPVDMNVKNPLFGSSLTFDKANRTVVNTHFGKGVPDYDAVSNKKGKWVFQVQGDGLPDWTELYPLHKFACAGDADGVLRCIRLAGIPPDERDSDTWSPLHYACWYGELAVVKALVEEAKASIGIQNNSGSTPLHLAAATGHKDVVSYLLQQKGIGRLMAALDNDGKSPLAVCLECKMNDWIETSQMLREAYKGNAGDTTLPVSPTLLSFSSQPTPSVENLLFNRSKRVEEDDMFEDLDTRGSLRHIDQTDEGKSPPKKGKGKDQTVRRHRVNFMSGQHRVAHFFNGQETPAGDVIQDLYRLMKLNNEYHSLFALWVVSRDLEIQLGDTDKPLRLMSTWKKFVAQYQGSRGNKSQHLNDQESPVIYLRRNIFYPVEREKTVSDPIALEFLYSDVQRNVLSGYYPCSEDDALYLAGITMQILYGDYNPTAHKGGFLKDNLEQVLPHHMVTSKRRVEFERCVLAKYAETTNADIGETKLLYVTYLKHCRQWRYYGAVFFDGVLQAKRARLMYHGKLTRKSELHIGIGVNTMGFQVVNRETNAFLDTLPLDSVDWDVSKNQIMLYRKDRSVNLVINTKKASLIHSLVTRMVEQYKGVGAEGSRTSITSA